MVTICSQMLGHCTDCMSALCRRCQIYYNHKQDEMIRNVKRYYEWTNVKLNVKKSSRYIYVVTLVRFILRLDCLLDSCKPHDAMHGKVFLTPNLFAHASLPVIWSASNGSQKMLVILRQGLYLFLRKESQCLSSPVTFYVQQMRVFMNASQYWVMGNVVTRLIRQNTFYCSSIDLVFILNTLT